MTRILGIELRRSAAVGTALILLVIGTLLLFFAGGIVFSDGWLQLAMTQRLYLALLWPLALAAGAWQARREHRSNVNELFASTPLPRVRRAVPVLTAMAAAVLTAYLAMGLAGGAWIIGTARYLPAQTFAVTAVGVLALVAAVWLGLAIGRVVPSLLTAPALSVAGLALLLLLPAITRPRGWLALVFSPIYEMNMPGPWASVPGRVSAAQAVWLAALALTAVLVVVSAGWRIRVAALLPVLAGAALAIAVMPHQDRTVTDGVDRVAQEFVCTEDAPRVCVTRVHAGLLPEVTAPAREGLAFLAKLPGAPTEVHQDTTTYGSDIYPAWRTDVSLLRVETGPDGHLKDRATVAADVVAGAFASPPGCEKSAGYAETLAVAAWLTGREPVGSEYSDPALVTEAGELAAGLRKLPADEARARVQALRRDAANCAVGADPLSGVLR